ncbi:MAG: hypothetical protein AAB489_01295 [Patescibacteria group bacterium]
MNLFLLLGILGMALILIGFYLLETHRISADDLSYDVLNFFGSGLLVLNALESHAWPFLMLNVVWGLVALRDIALDLQRGTHRSIVQKG